MYDVGPPTRRREDGGTREEGGGKPQLRTDLEGGISPDIFTGNIQGLREFATSGKRKETNYIKMKETSNSSHPTIDPLKESKNRCWRPLSETMRRIPLCLYAIPNPTPLCLYAIPNRPPRRGRTRRRNRPAGKLAGVRFGMPLYCRSFSSTCGLC